ncbi:MAG: hypothetical protein R3B90_22845 [Planctomycetaceae bacterium]
MYEAALQESDRLADESFSQADAIARREQMVREVDEREEQLALCNDDLLECESAIQQMEERWCAEWRLSGITPRSPAAMLDWHSQCEQYCAAISQLASTQQQVDALTQRVETSAAELRQFAGERLGPTETAVVKRVEERALQVRSAEQSRRELSTQLDRTLGEIELLEPEEHEASRRRGQWKVRFEQWLIALNLPRGWRIDSASEVLSQLASNTQARDAVNRLTERLGNERAELERIRSEVDALSQSAGLSSTGTLAERAERLGESLEEARTARNAFDTATQRRREVQQKLDSRRREMDRLDQDLGELATRCGCANAAVLSHAVAQFEQAAALDQQMSQLQVNLRMALGEEWEARGTELAGSGEADLRARERSLSEDLEHLEETYKREVTSLQGIVSQLAKLSTSTDARDLAAQLEDRRAKLAALVHQWGPLAITDALMRRALDRFQKERQPKLLDDVGELLSRMTQGEYVGLRRTLGTDGSMAGDLRVLDRGGQELRPDQLSTGGSDLVYLAIRLAFAMDYCQTHEPLPLIMDDVLNHFDETRARQTLRVLAECSATTQVVLLSCHRRTVELWEQVCPGEPIIELQGVTEEVGDADAEGASRLRTGRKGRGRRTKSDSTEGPSLFPASS